MAVVGEKQFPNTVNRGYGLAVRIGTKSIL